MRNLLPWALAFGFIGYMVFNKNNQAQLPSAGPTSCVPQPQKWLIDGMLIHEDNLKNNYVFWPDNPLLPPLDGAGWYKEDQFSLAAIDNNRTGTLYAVLLDSPSKRAAFLNDAMLSLVANNSNVAAQDLNWAYTGGKSAGGKVGPHTNIIQQCI
jgi:hypothetical protein